MSLGPWVKATPRAKIVHSYSFGDLGPRGCFPKDASIHIRQMCDQKHSPMVAPYIFCLPNLSAPRKEVSGKVLWSMRTSWTSNSCSWISIQNQIMIQVPTKCQGIGLSIAPFCISIQPMLIIVINEQQKGRCSSWLVHQTCFSTSWVFAESILLWWERMRFLSTCRNQAVVSVCLKFSRSRSAPNSDTLSGKGGKACWRCF